MILTIARLSPPHEPGYINWTMTLNGFRDITQEEEEEEYVRNPYLGRKASAEQRG